MISYNIRWNILIDFYFNSVKKDKYKFLRRIIKARLKNRFNIIVGLNSVADVNLLFPHKQNIVIGESVVIGRNCLIYQDVTIGQNKGKYPKIGNNVIVYAGAKVIGDVHVGDNAIIGANAVVTKDVPENAIMAGIPAKVIGYRGEDDEFY